MVSNATWKTVMQPFTLPEKRKDEQPFSEREPLNSKTPVAFQV